MHENEIPVDDTIVAGLIASQFPEWAALPLRRLASPGTVNAIYRLGDQLTVRLPFIDGGAEGIRHDAEWLPRLAPKLAVAIPDVRGVGVPDATYPSPWLVVDWLPGVTPAPGEGDIPDDLAAFILALRQVDTGGAPPAYRGGRLAPLDTDVRECLRQIDDLVDVELLTALWSESVDAKPWEAAPVWVHSDLLPGNVLIEAGRLVGVIDFGASGIGDPACDLMAAWSILPPAAREPFRARLDVDDDTWLRGRGWALAQAAIALPYYRETNREMADNSLYMLTHIARHAT
jgi:aminoglycoside phosphotransferase (APT) family kinase protein